MKKKPEELTDEEVLRELFPAKVVKEAKKAIEKAEKSAPTPKKKPEKSSEDE